MAEIRLEHLTVNYQKHKGAAPAVADVSLTVPSGTVCAVIGPSGCGKSTLLKVAAGLLTDYQGKVTVDGQAIDNRKLTIGFMPQNYGLLPWRTAEENIRLGKKIRGGWQEADEKRLGELASLLGLTGLLERYPHELSGGQQQRVSLARIFLLQPDILLMDEPFSALDAITREEMQDVFRELWQREAVTTMLVTHYVEEALYLGQQIAVMSAGPGHVQEIIRNETGGQKLSRSDRQFFELGQQLRQKIKGGRPQSQNDDARGGGAL